ncbi:hypothetical protein ACIQBJ_15300 [Kitasatospora sp. NPDC088391]|uniref:hypothetical protein n=1 Tax=Kitasatospora sp. NPDC088391 TaxID=3364074 RepID=UPI003806B6B8
MDADTPANHLPRAGKILQVLIRLTHRRAVRPLNGLHPYCPNKSRSRTARVEGGADKRPAPRRPTTMEGKLNVRHITGECKIDHAHKWGILQLYRIALSVPLA